jgi:hypothetical protein
MPESLLPGIVLSKFASRHNEIQTKHRPLKWFQYALNSTSKRATSHLDACRLTCNIPKQQLTISLNLKMETAIDIAFIQQPHTYHNQVTGISRKYRIFACGNGRKRAAVVVVNKQFDALLTSQLSEEDIVVVEIIQGNLKFTAASLYLDINNEITMDLYKIENILQFANRRGLLVAMDSNARSKSWHDMLTNKRGRKLEEFVKSNHIHIVNEDSKLTTFESNRGTSNVDLTIADNKMVTLLNTWQCNEQESFSDHRIITFSIEKR